MENSIATFWGEWGKISGANVQTWCNNSQALHHDIALANVLLNVRQFFAPTKMTVVPDPPYSSDLRTCEFFLFLKMKLKLKGRCYNGIEEIQTESKTLTRNAFQKCFRSWKFCWKCCINAKGDYFKEDGANINFGKWLSYGREIFGTFE